MIWKSVDESLPRAVDDVLVATDKVVTVGRLGSGVNLFEGDFYFRSDEVTHWTDFPPPPAPSSGEILELVKDVDDIDDIAKLNQKHERLVRMKINVIKYKRYLEWLSRRLPRELCEANRSYEKVYRAIDDVLRRAGIVGMQASKENLTSRPCSDMDKDVLG